MSSPSNQAGPEGEKVKKLASVKIAASPAEFSTIANALALDLWNADTFPKTARYLPRGWQNEERTTMLVLMGSGKPGPQPSTPREIGDFDREARAELWVDKTPTGSLVAAWAAPNVWPLLAESWELLLARLRELDCEPAVITTGGRDHPGGEVARGFSRPSPRRPPGARKGAPAVRCRSTSTLAAELRGEEASRSKKLRRRVSTGQEPTPFSD